MSSDPAASAQNNLQRQFWGDYNTLVSKGDHRVVHLHRQPHGRRAARPSTPTSGSWSPRAPTIEEEEREADRKAGKDAPEEGDVPAPPTDCPAQFGNTDVFVSVITP